MARCAAPSMRGARPTPTALEPPRAPFRRPEDGGLRPPLVHPPPVSRALLHRPQVCSDTVTPDVALLRKRLHELEAQLECKCSLEVVQR